MLMMRWEIALFCKLWLCVGLCGLQMCAMWVRIAFLPLLFSTKKGHVLCPFLYLSFIPYAFRTNFPALCLESVSFFSKFLTTGFISSPTLALIVATSLFLITVYFPALIVSNVTLILLLLKLVLLYFRLLK